MDSAAQTTSCTDGESVEDKNEKECRAKVESICGPLAEEQYRGCLELRNMTKAERKPLMDALSQEIENDCGPITKCSINKPAGLHICEYKKTYISCLGTEESKTTSIREKKNIGHEKKWVNKFCDDYVKERCRVRARSICAPSGPKQYKRCLRKTTNMTNEELEPLVTALQKERKSYCRLVSECQLKLQLEKTNSTYCGYKADFLECLTNKTSTLKMKIDVIKKAIQVIKQNNPVTEGMWKTIEDKRATKTKLFTMIKKIEDEKDYYQKLCRHS